MYVGVSLTYVPVHVFTSEKKKERGNYYYARNENSNAISLYTRQVETEPLAHEVPTLKLTLILYYVALICAAYFKHVTCSYE